jgi:integrase
MNIHDTDLTTSAANDLASNPSRTISTAMGDLTITADAAADVVDTIGKARSANTARAHASRIARFSAWLDSQGMHLIDGVPVPAPVVVTYLCHRWDSGRKMNTIDADLSSISYWHTAQGLDSPLRDRAVRDAFAGLKRKTAEAIRGGDASRAPVRADAAVADVVRRMVRAIDAQAEPEHVAKSRTMDAQAQAKWEEMHRAMETQAAKVRAIDAYHETLRLRDRAMLLLGFAMGARRGEIAALHVNHIEWHPQGIIVSVWAGKTGDRRSEITFNGDPSMCAITAIRQWMEHAGITSGALFRQIVITPRGERKALIREAAITGQAVNRVFAKWASAADLPSGRWTAHALRAGFIVQAVIDNVPESQIRAQTGHRGADYFGYAQRAQAFKIRRNAAL